MRPNTKVRKMRRDHEPAAREYFGVCGHVLEYEMVGNTSIARRCGKPAVTRNTDGVPKCRRHA